MQLESKKYLYDIQQAAAQIVEFTTGKRFEDNQNDPMLRAAVERKCEIIGEALTQLSKLDTTLIPRIGEYRRIISFRNILIHGYVEVDDSLVWGVVQTKLPRLQSEVEAILN